MTAPPRPRALDTAAEVERARGADFAAGLFLAGIEAAANDHGWTAGAFDEALRRSQRALQETDADYRRRVAAWEAQAPARRAADLAYERAWQRRAAGPGQQAQIAAAMDWSRPSRPMMG